MKHENKVNYEQVQEISRILYLQIVGIKRALVVMAAGFACIVVSALSVLPLIALIALFWLGFCLFVGPAIYLARWREPNVPDLVLTLLNQYQPNNRASVKEFEAFYESFSKDERRDRVIRWCSREQDFLRADELAPGRLAFLSRN